MEGAAGEVVHPSEEVEPEKNVISKLVQLTGINGIIVL